jgi:hypothetical protein
VWDIDTSPEFASTSLVTFKNCNTLLGNGTNNVGWRLGHVSGGGADISNYQWENCAAYGNEGEATCVAGQIGWLVEGRNTLLNSWFGGLVHTLTRSIAITPPLALVLLMKTATVPYSFTVLVALITT